MAKKTEYLIIQYASNGSIIKQLRAPKSVNLRVVLERLISRNLDDDALVRSCLRSNATQFYDPFDISDMREDHRREQARLALKADAETQDPLGVYNRARNAHIPLGSVLMMAGVSHDFHVIEVEV